MVKESDKGMAEAVEVLEKAKHARIERQQKVSLLTN